MSGLTSSAQGVTADFAPRRHAAARSSQNCCSQTADLMPTGRTVAPAMRSTALIMIVASAKALFGDRAWRLPASGSAPRHRIPCTHHRQHGRGALSCKGLTGTEIDISNLLPRPVGVSRANTSP